MSVNPHPSPKVLVIRGGAIGDFIVTLPSMRLLKESIPGARLEVLGYSGICELAVAAGVADATWSLDHRSMATLFAPGAPVDAAVEERLKAYSLAVSFLYDPDGHFRGNLERLGVKTLIECPHRVVDGAGPAPSQLARPLERLAMFLEDPAPIIHSRSQDRALRSVILHPGSGSLSKNWAVSNWRAVAAMAGASFPEVRWILVTGEAEAERGQTDEATVDWPTAELEHWESLPLVELADRLAKTDAVFLGHDSGISHLAAACGRPCFLLFGPTDPTVWAPANSGVEVFHHTGSSLAELRVERVWERLKPWMAGLLKDHPSCL